MRKPKISDCKLHGAFKLKQTPAQAAGIERNQWTVAELMERCGEFRGIDTGYRALAEFIDDYNAGFVVTKRRSRKPK